MAARTARKVPAKPAFIAPKVDDRRGPGRPPASRAASPVSAIPIPPGARRIDGVAVVKEEPVLSGLSGRGKQVPLKMSRLTLADGTVRHGCAECGFIADKRGDVMAHRMREHPGAKAQAKAGPTAMAGVPMTMTLAELLELARSSAEWGSMMDALTERAEKAEKRADDAEAAMKKLKAALSRAGFRLDERDEG